MQGYLKINQDKVVGSCHIEVGWGTVLNAQVIHLTILYEPQLLGLGNMTNSSGIEFQ